MLSVYSLNRRKRFKNARNTSYTLAQTVSRSEHVRKGLSLDDRLLSIVPRNPVVVVAEVGAFHILKEFFVVRDDNQLEIRLLPSCSDDVVERLGKGPGVVMVEIRRRLVQRNEPTVDAKALGQREADDDAGQHLLSRAAPASHVHFRLLFDHAHPVVVRSVAAGGFIVRTDQDRVHVRTLIGFLP